MTWWILRRLLAPLSDAAIALALQSDSQLQPLPLPRDGDDEIGQLIGGFNRLLTTLAQREDALRESEFRWKFAIEGTGDAMWDWNVQDDGLYFSAHWAHMIGYEEHELGHELQMWESRIHPEDKVATLHALQQHLLGQTTTYRSEYRLRCKDGSYLWLLDRGAVVTRGVGGEALRVIGTHTDISKRKQGEAERAMLTSRAEALLSLPGAAERLGEKDFMQHGLDLAEQLTGSQIGFIHFVMLDQETLELVTWSSATLAHYCQAGFDTHYPVSQAGIWADALRQRAPVICNDYGTATDKHGLPEGHARLNRLISVPVLDSGLVRLMAGVGNKPGAYSELDVETMQLMANTLWNIVRQRRADAALRESEERHRLLADNASDVIWTMDMQGRYTYVSPSVQKIRGFTSAEVMQHSWEQTLAPNSLPVAQQGLQKFHAELAAGSPHAEFRGELEMRCKNGATIWVEITANDMRSQDGNLIGILGVTRDITQRRVQQMQLRVAAQIFEQAREGITVADAQGNIIMVNRAFSDITGYSEAEVLGKNPSVLSSGRQDPTFYQTMWAAIKDQGEWAGEIWNRHKDGTIYPEWLSIAAIRDESGETLHYVGNFNDLSRVRAAEDRVLWMSHFDALTGLPNRTLLQDRTLQAMTAAHRSGEPLTLMLVGIDHYRSLADAVGQRTMDETLVEMARRLNASVREQDTVARLGGKEFVLVLPGTPSTGASHLATELLWKLARPYQLGQHELDLTTSIGVANYPDNGSDFDALLKSVTIAMHRAQSRGGDAVQFYSAEMSQQLQARDRIVKALRHAVERDQLALAYQPQVDLQTGKVCGLEALLRWQHPELGAVPPAQFIPLAEASGLINELGQWVLERACSDIRHWLEQGIQVPHVAVNVSALQFKDNDLPGQVLHALERSRIDPGQLYVELTESALMADVEHSEAVLHELKALGVKLSLDDFGTGYSSLSYLKRFPIDQVKIDQSFVRDIGQNDNDLVLVKVIVSMAHGLGMKVIAEGVETEAQCEVMRTSRCDEIQGFFFSHPIAAPAIEALLREGRLLPAHLLHLHKPQGVLLLVDDEPNILAALKRLLRRDGYTILTADCGAQGLEVLARNRVDVIISDQRMPGMTGVEFLRAAKLKYPDTVRIVLSGYTELQSVTDAINEGAVYRFLTKPWVDEQLREHIQKAFEYQGLLEENRQLDLKIRSANRELVAANRQLGTVLTQTRAQVERDATSLAIVREALQHMPSAAIGVDDEGLMAFVNEAAQQLFAGSGPLLGEELAFALPAIATAIAAANEGVASELQINGQRYLVKWNAMGAHSRSRGKIVTLSTTGAMP